MNLASTAPGANSRPLALTAERITLALLCIFVFTIPWEKGLWVGGLGTIAKAAGLSAFLAGAFTVLLRRELRPPHLALLVAALFVGWSAATLLWSLDPAATVVRVITFVQLLGMLWLLWEFATSPARQRLVMQAFLMGAVTGSVITFVRFALNLQTYYRRYAATGFDPNTFGLILALSVPVALYLAFTSRTAIRWVYYLAAITVISAVLLTASRTALIATLLGFLFPALRWGGTAWRDRLATLALLGLLVLSLMKFAPSPTRERLSTIPSEIATGSLNSRKQIWKGGVFRWLERPLHGVGSGAYPTAVSEWLGRPSIPGFTPVAHNTFLSVLVECGLIGFAIYSVLLATMLASVWMMQPPERALWGVMLLVWAAGVSTLTWEQHKVTWLLFGLVVGVSGSAWWRRGAGK